MSTLGNGPENTNYRRGGMLKLGLDETITETPLEFACI